MFEDPVGDDDTNLRIQAVAFLSRHQRMIQAYSYSIVNDFHLAEDVAQEVALIIASQWEAMPEPPGREPWLKEVIRRKSLEVRRRHRERESLLPAETLELVADSFTLDIDAQPESEAAPSDRREALSRCLARLSGDARAVVEARYQEDLDCAAIAERVKRPISSIYTILKRARAALAECVERGVRVGRA